MRCSKCKKMIIAYIEGALPHRTMEKIAEHLRTCATCSREYESFLKVTSALSESESPVKKPAADIKDRVLYQIANNGRQSVSKWDRRSWLSYASAVTAAVLFIAFGLSIIYTNTDRSEENRMQQAVQKPTLSSTGNEGVSKDTSTPADNQANAKEADLANKNVGRKPQIKRTIPRETNSAARSKGSTATGKGGNVSGHLDTVVVKNVAGSDNKSDAQVMPSKQDWMLKTMKAPAEIQTPEKVDESTSYPENIEMGNGPHADQGELQQEEANGDAKKVEHFSMDVQQKPLSETEDQIRLYEQRLESSPDDSATMLKLLELYQSIGSTHKEYEMADRLTKLVPDDPEYWFIKAQAAEKVGMPKTALVCYRYAMNKGLSGARLDIAKRRVESLEKQLENE